MQVTDRFKFYLTRLAERLWVRPLGYSLLAVLLLAGASSTDALEAPGWLPEIPYGTVEQLLSIITTTMLAVATFAVASMVSAYAAASHTATPRAFRLVVADQSSQNALSTFIGSFIYGVLALVAVKSEVYDQTGLFSVFTLTLAVFAWVILTFVRWVDDIARLGRVSNTLTRVEEATKRAFEEVRAHGALGGTTAPSPDDGRPVSAEEIGYVQHVDMQALQDLAEKHSTTISVDATPGTFVFAGRSLGRVHGRAGFDPREVVGAFHIAENRSFTQDPRFGLVVLAETASRALSPGVNDPGTAIEILGRLARIFTGWVQAKKGAVEVRYGRVHVAALDADDLFDDAFTAMARDGAANLEVGIRLQKVLASLSSLGDEGVERAALRHSRTALSRAEVTMAFPQDAKILRELTASLFVDDPGSGKLG